MNAELERMENARNLADALLEASTLVAGIEDADELGKIADTIRNYHAGMKAKGIKARASVAIDILRGAMNREKEKAQREKIYTAMEDITSLALRIDDIVEKQENPAAKWMDGIIKIAETARKGEDGHEDDDIGEDGLLTCSRCRKPRQMVLDVPLIGERIVPIMCDCDKAKKEQEEARRRAIEEMERIKQMRAMGITNKDYLEKTFANDKGYDPAMASIAMKYVINRKEMQAENMGLLLHGSTGGGKTYWAAAIANAMIDNGCSALITTVPQLITAMSKDYERDKADILARVANVRFLVLDDIGFERQTQYAAEKMFEIIDTRYRAKRPLIVTTNLTLDEIKNPSTMEYKRVFDRIVEMCQPVYVSGEGRRTVLAREKSIKAREILGL